MDMHLNLGIVGTGWISECFADACLITGQYKIVAVCSRNIGRAKKFGKKYGAALCFDDIKTMSAHPDIDVVYVASPNSLHYEHCIVALSAGKHVIVEKPAFSNILEAKAAFSLAEKNNVMLFEAARHIYESNHQIVKRRIADMGKICGASLTYMQRSSRYDLLLRGQTPNIFSLEYSGGALMDLGIYLVYAAVDWFGIPNSARYFCQKLSTGVDSGGIIVLNYPSFYASLTVSKIADSRLPCEIQSDRATLQFDAVHNIGSISLIENNYERLELALQKRANWMLDEVVEFVRIIRDESNSLGEYERLRALAINVHSLITSLRADADIVFLADNEVPEA